MTLQPLQEMVIRTLDTLHTRSTRFILVLGAVLILLIGVLDYLTGFELSFSIFYLLPLTMLAWYAQASVAITASFASALVWLVVDVAGGREYSFAAIPFWNAAVRLFFFLIVTITISALRRARVDQDEMAHFIVHDLRAPLSSLLAGLALLDDQDFALSTEDQSTVVKLGISSCNRMLILINSLLDLGSLESGKLVVNKQEISVQEVLTQSVQQVRALATRSEVRIDTDVMPGSEIAFADPELTVRIIVNLLSNAVRYSPPESTILVCAEPENDQMIRISIADQGPGIPADWVNKIFKSYVQVQARKAGIGVGSGLGLSFCRLATEVQGGRIWVESVVGQGTKFIFTVPII